MLAQKFEIIERRPVTVIVQTDDPHKAYEAIERWTASMPASVDDVCATGDWQPYEGGDIVVLDVDGKVVTNPTAEIAPAPTSASQGMQSVDPSG